MLEEVPTVEERSLKGLLPTNVGQICLRRDARCHDQLLGHHCLFPIILPCRGQEPRPIQPMLSALHICLQADTIGEAKVLRVLLHVCLHDVAGNMFAGLDVKEPRGHGEVAEFVGAQHVVGLEALVESVLRPDAAHGRRRFKEENIAGRVNVEIGFDSGQTTPACILLAMGHCRM